MAVAEQARLTPPVKCFAFFVVEQSHDSFLIVHISFLANKWTFHLIDWLLEKLLILSDEQLSDALKAALSLRDGVNLDALDEDLDEWCGFGELSPSQWQTIQ